MRNTAPETSYGADAIEGAGFVYRKGVSGDPIPRARRQKPVALARLQGRFARLMQVALAAHGDLAETRRLMGINPRTLRSLLGAVRSAGLGVKVTAFRPPAMGRPFECLTLVRLAAKTCEAIDSFNGWCIGDPAVTCAVQVCGVWDYQLTSFHADRRAAVSWRRELEDRPEVGRADQKYVTTLKGHHLPGVAFVERFQPMIRAWEAAHPPVRVGPRGPQKHPRRRRLG